MDMQLQQDDLLRAYRTMKTIREFEERLHVENATGDIPGFIHLYAGQEAIAAAVCFDLGTRDHIGSTHRGHGHSIAKGCDVTGMMLEIFGRRGGLCGGKGGSMHIADLDHGMLGANAIVGGAPILAIGAALTSKVKDNKSVAISFTGDGGSNQGTVFEAMNMAVVLKLPCVFIFENNGYGEATGVSYAVGTPSIANRAAAFGMPAVTVDGTDFFAVYEAARDSIARARNGEGPSAIEAKASRFYGHYEGDAQRYRACDEGSDCRRSLDCLVRFRDRVTQAGLLSSGQLTAVDTEVLAVIDAAVSAARAAPPPSTDDLLTDVYLAY
jgi:pyruvate dehydrogenase E1 component alpha subunit